MRAYGSVLVGIAALLFALTASAPVDARRDRAATVVQAEPSRRTRQSVRIAGHPEHAPPTTRSTRRRRRPVVEGTSVRPGTGPPPGVRTTSGAPVPRNRRAVARTRRAATPAEQVGQAARRSPGLRLPGRLGAASPRRRSSTAHARPAPDRPRVGRRTSVRAAPAAPARSRTFAGRGSEARSSAPRPRRASAPAGRSRAHARRAPGSQSQADRAPVTAQAGRRISTRRETGAHRRSVSRTAWGEPGRAASRGRGRTGHLVRSMLLGDRPSPRKTTRRRAVPVGRVLTAKETVARVRALPAVTSVARLPRPVPMDRDGAEGEPPRPLETPSEVVVPMVFPVVGRVDWTDTFSLVALPDQRRHLGQDLMAPKMRPLVAVFDGRVQLHQRGTHNMLILRSEDGWTAWYMHLNNDSPGTDDGLGSSEHAYAPGLRSGDWVVAGQLIGWVGDSGNAEGTLPHCHFELHGPGGVVNPAPSLRAARRLSGPITGALARSRGASPDRARDSGRTVAVARNDRSPERTAESTGKRGKVEAPRRITAAPASRAAPGRRAGNRPGTKTGAGSPRAVDEERLAQMAALLRPRRNESRWEGIVRSVDVEGGWLTIEVTELRSDSAPAGSLMRRSRILDIWEAELLVAPGRTRLSLKDLASGVRVQVVGRERPSGRPSQARQIAVWLARPPRRASDEPLARNRIARW